MKNSITDYQFLTITNSLWYDRWLNLAVMFGVLCATAVLTGALLVGNSMRGSLRNLTLDRLGSVDTVLFAPNFIDYHLDTTSAKSGYPVIYLQGSAEYNGNISGTQILAGVTIPASWDASFIVNQALADKLQLKDGGELSLRLLSPQSIPPESSFGKKDNLIRTKITVDTVIANRGIGRFSLKADQQAEPLLIVPLDWLQKKLEVGDKVNAVFYNEPVSAKSAFTPTLDDLGITFSPGNSAADKHYITSQRMLFTNEQTAAIEKALKEGNTNSETDASNSLHKGLLYLTTSIKATKNGKETPYSTVFSFSEPDAKQSETSGLTDEEIALNQWTADDLNVSAGDEIELTWFEPDNVNITKSQKFKLAKIIPDGQFTNEVVPDVKGFTDEASIADWDPPFPFDAKKIRKKDEDYWDKYQASPKAFLSLETGQKLFGSRFGKISTFIISDNFNAEPFRLSVINEPLSVWNLNFVPVKKLGLQASQGTTPFSILFLCFSFFIIASALMLIALLFRLSVEMKAKQIGIRLACGWTIRQVLKIHLAEGIILAMSGSFFGIFFGIFYAAVMIYGLTTWWVDAVTVPFLTLHIEPLSLLFGYVSGIALAMLTITCSLRNIKRIPVKTLLGGNWDVPVKQKKKKEKKTPVGEQRFFWMKINFNHPFTRYLLTIFAGFMFAVMFAFIHNAYWMFFVWAFVLLINGLGLFNQLSQFSSDSSKTFRSLAGLSKSNIFRKRGRSLLGIGLVASTVFLVLSISAFRLDPREEIKYNYRGNGSGGFDLIAETAFPAEHDIYTPEGRAELGIQPKDEMLFDNHKIDIIPIRATNGDNAGCSNLYQTGNPRILGVPCSRLRQHSNFRFAAPQRKIGESSPWFNLTRTVSTDPDGIQRVPVILDLNTAMYSLHLYKGIGETFEIPFQGVGGINPPTIRCEVTGLLSNSILQGEILMSEENFLHLFPDVSGWKYFLIRNSQFMKHKEEEQLLTLLGDYGVQIESATDRLRKLFSVQNTYLSTFQSLGGIGLLLGTFGLAVIQIRNVFERRKELALFSAIGFKQSKIILLLLYENLTLLFYGLAFATFASFFALLPFLFGFASQELSTAAMFRQFVQLTGSMILIGLVSNIAASLFVLKIPAAKELAEER